MRKPLVAANWKMNLTACEASALSEALIEPLGQYRTIDIAVCPAYVFLTDVVRKLTGTNIQIGVQNISWEEKGAFTGEVAARMVDSLARYVIIGHSERRTKLGETDGMVNWKVIAAVGNSLAPIVCVGEDLATREAGKTESHIQSQVTAALKAVEESSLEELVIAYEPLWAIGTGKTAEVAQIDEAAGIIRATLESLYSTHIAQSTRVLYGGSVNASNAAGLLKAGDIDGFLVGNASLQVQEFAGICKAASERKTAIGS